MINLYKDVIVYNPAIERAVVLANEPINFALLITNQDCFCWVNVKVFFLKNFTWTWISVKNSEGEDTNQIFNINSIAKHVGLTPDEIIKANDDGKLYLEIDCKLNPPLPPTLPKSDDRGVSTVMDQTAKDFGNLMGVKLTILEKSVSAKSFFIELNRIKLTLLNNRIDQSSEDAFIKSLCACYKDEKENRAHLDSKSLSTILLGFALTHYPCTDKAIDWIKTTFWGDKYVSVNNFEPANISFIFDNTLKAIKLNMESNLSVLT
jgi:hypothetical protein